MEPTTAMQAILWWIGVCASAAVLGIFVLWLGKQLLINEELDSLNVKWRQLHDLKNVLDAEKERLSPGEITKRRLMWLKEDRRKETMPDWGVWTNARKRMTELERRIEEIECQLRTKKEK